MANGIIAAIGMEQPDHTSLYVKAFENDHYQLHNAQTSKGVMLELRLPMPEDAEHFRELLHRAIRAVKVIDGDVPVVGFQYLEELPQAPKEKTSTQRPRLIELRKE